MCLASVDSVDFVDSVGSVDFVGSVAPLPPPLTLAVLSIADEVVGKVHSLSL